MNKNKGFIGLGLILAIVLGIVVVGGGAYYLGKGSNRLEVKNPENVLPNQENKNTTSTNNVVIPSDWKTYSDKEIGFEFKYPPEIVFDPRSNSAIGFRGMANTPADYGAGSQTLDSAADLDVKGYSQNGDTPIVNLIKVDGQDAKVVCVSKKGECTANITLPKPFKWAKYNIDGSDGYFKILVINPFFLKQKYVDQILSTFKFTVNSAPTKTISTTDWKTYTNADYGFSFQYPSNWETPSGSFNGKIFEVFSKESITVPFIDYHPSNNKLTMNDFVGNSWGHDVRDVPTKISVAGQNAYKFTYETTTNGRGQPYPLYNQQVGFPDNKGGFFVINFAVLPTEKENGVYLFNQILSSFTLQ